MTHRTMSLALAIAIAPPAIDLHAQNAINVAGGINAPVGRLGDITDLGYNVSLGLNLGGAALPVGIRLEGAYNGFGLKGGGGDVRILNGTANAIFNLGSTRDAPYVMAGLGAYNRNTSLTSVGSSSKTAVGINGGGGLRFPLSGISTFFEARYHVMLGNAGDGTNYQFIPITFGIMF